MEKTPHSTESQEDNEMLADVARTLQSMLSNELEQSKKDLEAISANKVKANSNDTVLVYYDENKAHIPGTIGLINTLIKEKKYQKNIKQDQPRIESKAE